MTLRDTPEWAAFLAKLRATPRTWFIQQDEIRILLPSGVSSPMFATTCACPLTAAAPLTTPDKSRVLSYDEDRWVGAGLELGFDYHGARLIAQAADTATALDLEEATLRTDMLEACGLGS